MESYNLVVIGAGSGGLVVAAGGAGLGARVALVEKHALEYTHDGKLLKAMGGDCLNFGCVPSKALLRAAKAAQHAREAKRYAIHGVSDPGAQDLAAVMDYVLSCQAHIAPHDSIERFEGLGVEVFQGPGRLRSANEVSIGDKVVKGRHIVIATGSRARIHSIPGLEEAGYLTNETVFGCRKLPENFMIMGGGPIGTEIGQAFSRLGSKVTIVSSTPHICPKEDADVAAVLLKGLVREGVTILDNTKATKVEMKDGKRVVTVKPTDGPETTIAVDQILVATGRRPNIENLNLEGVGVKFSSKGIETDARCRTNVPSIWAIGDVAGGYQFTHWAGYQAKVIIRNTLFPGSSKCDYGNLPWTTFTEPEIAHVGMNEESAKKKNVPHRVFTVMFDDNDRAVCDGEYHDYFAKVLVDPKGQILGATIVHPRAGDLLAELVLAKKHGLSLDKVYNTIHAYPTLGEINAALGGAYMRTKLSPTMRNKLTKVYQWLRR
jgi:pyruvate/2-oxoglutarate dehydrogenase complex dihydrolipoamide dehydrogenase (E3) component